MAQKQLMVAVMWHLIQAVLVRQKSPQAVAVPAMALHESLGGGLSTCQMSAVGMDTMKDMMASRKPSSAEMSSSPMVRDSSLKLQMAAPPSVTLSGAWAACMRATVEQTACDHKSAFHQAFALHWNCFQADQVADSKKFPPAVIHRCMTVPSLSACLCLLMMICFRCAWMLHARAWKLSHSYSSLCTEQML